MRGPCDWDIKRGNEFEWEDSISGGTGLNKMKFTLGISIPIVPDAILQTVQKIALDGDTLQSDDGIEWYLFDVDGELIDVLWLEDEMNR